MYKNVNFGCVCVWVGEMKAVPLFFKILLPDCLLPGFHFETFFMCVGALQCIFIFSIFYCVCVCVCITTVGCGWHQAQPQECRGQSLCGGSPGD